MLSVLSVVSRLIEVLLLAFRRSALYCKCVWSYAREGELEQARTASLQVEGIIEGLSI